MRHEIIKLFNQGLRKTEIATLLGIGYSTVRKHTKHLPTLPIVTTKFICRTCSITSEDNFYKDSPYHCKKCWNEKTYQSAKNNLLTYYKERGGAKCQQCGYDKCPHALDFHHRDPTKKDPKWRKNWSYARLKNELDKCDILCANCHRELHFNLRIQNKH